MNICAMYLRLVVPDAVLAGDGAAGVDAAGRRIAPASFSASSAWPVDGVVEEHQRVQVAVAGVEDVRHPQPTRLGHRGDLAAAPRAARSGGSRRPAR